MAQTKKKKTVAKNKPSAKAKTPAKAPAKKAAPKVAAKAVKKPVKKAMNKAVALVKKMAKKATAAVTSSASPVKKASSAPLIPSSFQPLDDRLIISVEPAAEKTAGGLFIPDTASERPSRGTVLAKGPGKRNKKGMIRPLDVAVGDTVLFPQFAGQKIEIGANEFLILREDEILGITT